MSIVLLFSDHNKTTIHYSYRPLLSDFIVFIFLLNEEQSNLLGRWCSSMKKEEKYLFLSFDYNVLNNLLFLLLFRRANSHVDS